MTDARLQVGPAPIVLGITGHRSLRESELPDLRNATERVLAHIDHVFPHTPRLLMSGLAEGADQIVARAALERGWSLIAMLPAPPEIYKESFSDTKRGRAAAQALEPLVEQSFRVHVETAQVCDPVDSYLLVGLRIASLSHVLLALWNGELGGVGGTGTTVYASICGESTVVPDPSGQKRIPPELETFRPSPVVWIPCTNENQDLAPVLQSGIKATRWIEAARPDRVQSAVSNAKLAFRPDGKPVHVPLRHLHAGVSMATFNREICRSADSSKQDIIEEAKEAGFTSADGIDGQGLEACMTGITDSVTAKWCFRYASADLVAKYSKRRGKHAFWTGILLIAIAIGIFELTTGPFPVSPWLLVLHITFLFASGIVLGRICDTMDRRHLTFREIAEQARVKMYLTQAVDADTSIADQLLFSQDHNDWVIPLLDMWEHIDEVRGLQPADFSGPDLERLKFIESAWLRGQQNYFEQALNLERRKLRWLRGLGQGTAGLALLSTFGVILAIFSFEVPGDHSALQWWLYLVVIALLFSGLLRHIVRYRALKEHVQRYGIACDRIACARARIQARIKSGDTKAAHQELVALGKEALRENAGWYVLHIERAAKPDI